MFNDIEQTKISKIDNLKIDSQGSGGMILSNDKFTIFVDWDKNDNSNINRISVGLNDDGQRISYYIQRPPLEHPL